MTHKLLAIFFLCLLALIIFYSVNSRLKNNKSYAMTEPIPHSVSVDAFIGEFEFTLFGYTSSKALVTIEGMGIYDQTYADNKGYFEFHNRFSPLSPREACLTARDQFGRTTSPTCIPPFPTKYDATIGPVLLPPTISVNKENYYQGDEVKLSGQTIPNSELTFSTFVDEKKSFFSVFAFTFPVLSAKADAKGNFSLSLPSSYSKFFRIFAQTSYDNGQSPESIKLNIKILPVWMIIIQMLMLLWSIIKSRLFEIIIIGELISITIFLIRRYIHPHVIARNRPACRPGRALALRKLYPIVEEETAITIPKSYPLTKAISNF